MSLVFYYSPFSSAATVHWALEELGVPYEKVKVDLKANDQKKPAYLAINPNGKVPAVVHDGTPIFESVAILLHLGETFGVDKNLFPAAGLKRAEAFKWLVWCQVSLGDALSRYSHNTSEHFPAELRHAKAGEVAKAEVEAQLAILDNALAGKKYLVDDRFSLVDVHLAGWVSYLGMVGFDQTRWPNIDAWTKTCTARPGYKTAMSP